ncbi:MAG: HD domain-containing protein [archaeon]
MYILKFAESNKLFDALIKEKNVKKHLDALKKHHLETYKHSLRVGLLSIDLGLENKLVEYEIKLLGYSGLLHDIGKLKIPRKILSKPTTLNLKEIEIMKEHSRWGILETKDIRYREVGEIVAIHHEYNPYPYPRKGKGDRRRNMLYKNERRDNRDVILKLGQIVAIADIYDALISKRVYKLSLPKEEVKKLLKNYFFGEEKYARQILER